MPKPLSRRRRDDVSRKMEGDLIHPLLPNFWEYEIIGLRLEREPRDEAEPYLDLVLRLGKERRTLRFWSPQNLQIDRGGPFANHGLTLLDISARGLEGIRVSVDDIESGSGGIYLVARSVE